MMDFNPSKTKFRNIFSRDNNPIDTSHLFPIPSSSTSLDTSLDTRAEKLTAGQRASKLLMDTYNEPDVATSRYNDYLASQPSESDYKPSKARMLSGVLAGFGAGLVNPEVGAQIGDKIIKSPFEDKLNDWQRRRAPLANAAATEEKSKTTRLAALKDFINSEHQNTMDTSLITDRTDQARHRVADEKHADAVLLDLVGDRQKRDEDRKADNLRQDARDKETAGFHKGELDNSGRMASVAERNATTGEGRANTYRDSVASSNAYRTHLKDKLANQKGDSPSAQKTAEELALHNILLDKPGASQIYGDYFNRDDKGRIIVTPPSKHFYSSDDSFNESLAGYAKFQKEIADEKGRILAKGHPTNTADQVPPPTNKKKPVSIVKKEIIP